MTRTEARAREGDPLLSRAAKIKIFADANGIGLTEHTLPVYDPDDPKELQRTLTQLYEETAKHLDVAAAKRLLGKFEDKAVVRRCAVCHHKFTPARTSALYCSSACQRKASRRRAQASA